MGLAREMERGNGYLYMKQLRNSESEVCLRTAKRTDFSQVFQLASWRSLARFHTFYFLFSIGPVRGTGQRPLSPGLD